jgi:Asp-tRNA(Asn)/Glu-tRNA(Gln) amidotransferase A subunit family amidase
LRKAILFLGILCMALSPAPGSAKTGADGVFSHGSGWIEVIVFSDYFCGACHDIEPVLEEALKDLSELGAKIVFVDYPSGMAEAIFSKYFLHAAHADNRLSEMLRTRRILFELAQSEAVKTERELIRALERNDIRLEPLEVNPILRQWNDLIQRHEIKSTPACVISWPPRAPQTHIGGTAMIEGLVELMEELAKRRK